MSARHGKRGVGHFVRHVRRRSSSVSPTPTAEATSDERDAGGSRNERVLRIWDELCRTVAAISDSTKSGASAGAASSVELGDVIVPTLSI